MAETKWERIKQRGAMLLIAAAMAAVCVAFTMRAARRLRVRLEDWPEVRATVVSHSKIQESFDRKPLGTASVDFRYVADGKEHRGTHTLDSEALATVKEFLAEHPVGSAITVYYDPGDPGDCVLEKSFGGRTVFHVAVAVLAGLGALVLAYFTVRPDHGPRAPEER